MLRRHFLLTGKLHKISDPIHSRTGIKPPFLQSRLKIKKATILSSKTRNITTIPTSYDEKDGKTSEVYDACDGEDDTNRDYKGHAKSRASASTVELQRGDIVL